MRKDHTKPLVSASIMAALIFVFTFFIYFPVTNLGAYMNFGDCVIYSAGMLVGAPWAAAAAALGSALADLAHGYPAYVPATIVIKGLMGFLCAILMRNANFGKYLLVCMLGGAIMVVGYGAFEMAFMGGWGYVSVTILPNVLQWGVGIAGAAALYYPVKRIKAVIG